MLSSNSKERLSRTKGNVVLYQIDCRDRRNPHVGKETGRRQIKLCLFNTPARWPLHLKHETVWVGKEAGMISEGRDGLWHSRVKSTFVTSDALSQTVWSSIFFFFQSASEMSQRNLKHIYVAITCFQGSTARSYRCPVGWGCRIHRLHLCWESWIWY